MKRPFVAAGLFVPILLVAGGCQPSTSVTAAGFLDGAFPPTLSDMDYHDDPWNRTDCRACHEDETSDAPPIVHAGVAPSATDSKCRLCHVPVEGKYVE